MEEADKDEGEGHKEGEGLENKHETHSTRSSHSGSSHKSVRKTRKKGKNTDSNPDD